MALPVELGRHWGVPPGYAIELPGRGTTFVREVSGPPDAPVAMLLHGLGATGALNWFSAFRPLSEHFRVLAIDLRGHGRGLRSRGRFRLADCADDVAALADQLGVARFIPVGYSMGGPIAQLLWHRHPQRVEGMVLCATSRDFAGHWLNRFQFAALGVVVSGLRLLPRRIAKQLAGELTTEGLTQAEQDWVLAEVARHDVRSLLEAADALGRFSSREWIRNVDVPVSVVVTADDRVVPVRRQVKLALAVPSAVMHVMDASHLCCGTEPERFVQTLVEACQLVTQRALSRPAESHGDRLETSSRSRKTRRRMPSSKPWDHSSSHLTACSLPESG